MRELEAIHARDALLARLRSRPTYSTESEHNVDPLISPADDPIDTGRVFPLEEAHSRVPATYVFVSGLSSAWTTLCFPSYSTSLFGATLGSAGSSISTATVKTRAVPVLRAVLTGSITSFAIECLRDNEIRGIVANLDKITEIPFAAQLKTRLEELHAIWQDENGPDHAMSVRSLHGLIGFLRRTPGVRMPSIVNTPKGAFVAEWRSDERHLFSVHFVSEGETRFVIFSPDELRRNVINRAFGETTVEHLLEIAKTWGADSWVCE